MSSYYFISILRKRKTRNVAEDVDEIQVKKEIIDDEIGAPYMNMESFDDDVSPLQ